MEILVFTTNLYVIKVKRDPVTIAFLQLGNREVSYNLEPAVILQMVDYTSVICTLVTYYTTSDRGTRVQTEVFALEC